MPKETTKQPQVRNLQQEMRDRQGAIPNPADPRSILNLTGFIQTVTTIPTKRPRDFYGQVKIYVDSLTAPTVYRLYYYSIDLDDWLYVALST